MAQHHKQGVVGTVREFAAALLDRVIDDAMLPHARKRAELRRKRRVNQMLALANE